MNLEESMDLDLLTKNESELIESKSCPSKLIYQQTLRNNKRFEELEEQISHISLQLKNLERDKKTSYVRNEEFKDLKQTMSDLKRRFSRVYGNKI